MRMKLNPGYYWVKMSTDGEWEVVEVFRNQDDEIIVYRSGYGEGYYPSDIDEWGSWITPDLEDGVGQLLERYESVMERAVKAELVNAELLGALDIAKEEMYETWHDESEGYMDFIALVLQRAKMAGRITK